MARLHAVILAGGSSRRMGSDKALLRHDGRTWLECVVGACRDAGLPVIVVGRRRPANWPWDDTEFLPDERPDEGPLAGLATGMRRARTDVLLLPCDAPLVDRELVTYIAESATILDEVDAVITRAIDADPTMALYSIRLLPRIDEHLLQSERSLMKLVRAVDGLVLELEPEHELRATSFNTPREWERRERD